MTNIELRQHIRESIFEILTEKLCKKGKAYVARRKAAGEKHSAYLMGRAVKVCKGMIGKKKNENTTGTGASVSAGGGEAFATPNAFKKKRKR